MKKPKADGFGEKIAERNRVIKLGNTYRLGKTHSEETKKILSEKRKSLDPSKYHRGFNVPEERKKIISESVKNLSKITCQNCGKQCSPSMHGRWHGDKCKHKK
jgi:hypothetical protein